MLSIFWDCKGILLMDVLPRGETINADKYCQQSNRLVVAIEQKWRRIIHGEFQQLYYLDDNVRPNTAIKK